MSKHKQSVGEFLQRLDGYVETEHGTVIIRPGLQYNFIELPVDFVQQLKEELRTKIMMVEAGVDEPDAITTFVLMILEDSY